MSNHRVSLRFVELSDPALDEFAANNVICLTGNSVFPNLPVAPAALGGLHTTFHNALVASAQGGAQLTAAKNEAREALEIALRKDAAYVRSIAGQNLSQLLSSGFKATTTTRTYAPLETPVVLNVDNQLSGKLLVDLGNIPNAAADQVRALTSAGVVVVTVESTRARKIELPGMTPGTTYSLEARAIGGSTGYSDWSLPTSIMAT